MILSRYASNEFVRLSVAVGCGLLVPVCIPQCIRDYIWHQIMREKNIERNQKPTESDAGDAKNILESSGCPFASAAKSSSDALAEFRAKKGRVIMLCKYINMIRCKSLTN